MNPHVSRQRVVCLSALELAIVLALSLLLAFQPGARAEFGDIQEVGQIPTGSLMCRITLTPNSWVSASPYWIGLPTRREARSALTTGP